LINEFYIGHVYVFVLPPVWQFPRLSNPLRWTLRHSAARFDKGLRKMLADQPKSTMMSAHIKMYAELCLRTCFTWFHGFIDNGGMRLLRSLNLIMAYDPVARAWSAYLPKFFQKIF
jgi:hypothetical protein